MSTNSQKRKHVEEVLFGKGNNKKSSFAVKQRFNALLNEKKLWIEAQRKASLMIAPYHLDPFGIPAKFQQLTKEILEDEEPKIENEEKTRLLDQLFQESIITEWPKMIVENDEMKEVDCAPLIHKARSVRKCRTQHPTLRVKVCAAQKNPSDVNRSINAIAMTLTLVKCNPDDKEDVNAIAGHLMLTKREGAVAHRSTANQLEIREEEHGQMYCLMTNPQDFDYSLVAFPRGTDKKVAVNSIQWDENDILTVSFPEIGMKIFSMVERRSLISRYYLKVNVEMLFKDGIILKHNVYTLPFLIAITNDQSQQLLSSLYWSRLASSENPSPSRMSETREHDEAPIKFELLKNAVQNFVKSQVQNGRMLDQHELLHIQCMLFLPRFVNQTNEYMIEQVKLLYDDISDEKETIDIVEVRQKLLSQFVKDDVLVKRKEFMEDNLVSLTDCKTVLQHSLWNWFYKAFEMIADIGHKLCTSTIATEKKVAKSKRISINSTSSNFNGSDDPITMLTLFNQRILTFTSRFGAYRLFQQEDRGRESMLLRFCEDNLGFISFVFSPKSEKAQIGSISTDQIKENKRGLLGILMEYQLPRDYAYLLKISAEEPLSASKEHKIHLFSQFISTLNTPSLISIKDTLFTTINPSNGAEIKTCDIFQNGL
uniref:Little elongation complex subunit 2 n=1 Tax=Rhabditophanes sp. KR3021 TaxID=114890 RepID=A0AC35TTI1_9BILA